MNIPRGRDLTKNSVARNHITDQLRPLPGGAFPPGTVLQLVPLDSQVFPDQLTVQPVPAGANQKKVMGVVAGEWASSSLSTPPGTFSGGGFDGLGNVIAGANPLTRGTQMVDAAIWGQTSVLVDNSGANAAPISDATYLTSSQVTPGYAQGTADANVIPPAVIGFATLPLAGFGSVALGAGALAAATQTVTIANPVVGGTEFVTLQTTFIQDQPGVVQTRTVTVTLNAATAASATTAAAALVAAINADPVLNKIYVAANAAGVITITVLATGLIALYPAASYLNTSLGVNTRVATINTAGTVGNQLTIASGGTGGTTAVSGAATFAGGTGYKGLVPVFINPAAGI